MTDADTLRRAAHQVRERATQATPGPWAVYDPGLGRTKDIYAPDGALRGQGRELPVAERVFGRDAAHIAGMDPGVAQALADWLGAEADEYDQWAEIGMTDDEITKQGAPGTVHALHVARTILGDTP